MKCPRCGVTFRDETAEYAPDVCSNCADDEEYSPLDGAWRPHEPGVEITPKKTTEPGTRRRPA